MKGLRVGASEVYQKDIATLKQYRPDYYRLTFHRSLRRAGYEEVSGDDGGNRIGTKNTAGNSAKLAHSLSRTKSTIFELALCNDWEYFVSLTLNPNSHDRTNIKAFKKKLLKWLNNYKQYHDTNIKYLLIPEQHADGAWHMHGLLSGLPAEHLTAFSLKDKLPLPIRRKLKKGRTIYNWEKYAKAFGYVTVEEILNAEAISKYITKYITADLFKTRIDLNDHMYYCSLGLRRAAVIYKNHLTRDFEPDFENEYVKVKTFQSLEEAIYHFTDENE